MPRETLLKALRKVKECRSDPLYSTVLARAECKEVYWEQVNKVTKAGKRDVYDFEIPHTKVFALHNGVVVYDTMSYHIPVSDSAVEDAYKKMLPSKNLLHAQTFEPHYVPSQEYTYGLYLASKGKKGRRRHEFATKEDAMKAYKRGEVGVNDEVVIHK